jgi:hypothetical protein
MLNGIIGMGVFLCKNLPQNVALPNFLPISHSFLKSNKTIATMVFDILFTKHILFYNQIISDHYDFNT